MRRIPVVLLVLLAVLLTASLAQGTTYFVRATAGSDTNPGTSWANAWKSIDKVNSALRGGDTVFFGAGNYFPTTNSLTPPANTNGADRTCYADSALWAGNRTVIGGKAVIWGGYNVRDSAWTLYSGNIFRTKAFNPANATGGGTFCKVLVVDDSIYTSRSALTGVSGPGQFHYDVANDFLYVWFWGNSTPAQRSLIVPSCRAAVAFESGSADYTTFWGLRFYASHAAAVYGGIVDQDSMFIDHCVMKFIGNSHSNNTGGYYGSNYIDADNASCGGNLDCPYQSHRKWNRMRACSTLYIKWEDYTGYRGTHITLYSESHFTAESSYFAWGGGIQYKQHGPIGMIGGGHSRGNVVKYCKIENAECGVTLLNYQTQDSIYGNVFMKHLSGDDGTWIDMRSGSVSGTLGQIYICNNTFYGVGKLIQCVYVDDPNYFNKYPNWFKYNLICDNDGSSSAGVFAMLYNREDTNWIVDSNLYWNVATGNVFRITGAAVSINSWRAQSPRPHDVRSSYNTKSPALKDPVAGDMSRPSVTAAEMDVAYGGRRWTLVGAWQPGDGGLANRPDKLGWILADSLVCDYQGENDSLRFRYLSSSQTFPDSVILAVSNNGTLPSSTQSSNRWSRPFAVSTLDTVDAALQILESDTLIVGGWVLDADSGLSDGVYDTIILIQRPPSPVQGIFVDSVHADFSAETDSIRFRAVPAAEAWPDSLVYAISLTSSLPTFGQAGDRWSRPYSDLKTDTFYVTKTVTEPDTVIAGVWVKEGGSYSPGRYDTLLLRQPPLSQVLSLAIDSLRSDFAGESDSLRIRYSTSVQTWPDSVILAFSSSTNPTVTSADRIARGYAASVTDTVAIARTLNETARLIVGAWVKDQGAYSLAMYDTITLTQPAPAALVGFTIDSVKYDYSAELDSIRFRYQTAAETWPESVIVAMSFSTTLPNVSQAGDRWSRPYTASSNASFFVSRQVNEPATLIVGGWVKMGNLYSPGHFDTLSLGEPLPNPVTLLAADSVRSDFNAESDSIVIRYQTSGQSFPDSVVIGLSTTTLPTSNADRLARAFAPGKLDSFTVVRSIFETDTLLVGAWVRHAGNWSIARYDTVIFYQQPPQPLLALTIDSATYDYSSENDSLRFSYQTGGQSWPDSVVIAISQTSALPTISSSDRWAKPFNPNANSRFFVSKLLNEPADIIVGGWVKEGGAWSSGVYDTIQLSPNFNFSDEQITGVSANAASIVWSTNLLSTSQVEYGTTTAYGFTTVRDANKVKDHVVGLTGLLPATTYYFRVISDPGSGPVQALDSFFTTSLATGSVLTISGEDTLSVSDSEAIIVWTTSSSATSLVEFGTTTAYGRVSVLDNNLTVSHQIPLTELSPKTTYHYRVVSVDAVGNRAVSVDHIFRTRRATNENLAKGKPPRTRSSGPGFVSSVITDTVIDPYGGNVTTWASEEVPGLPQWVEIDLGKDSTISRVVIYWAWDSAHNIWTTSQAFSLQRWNGSVFVDVAVVNSPEISEATVVNFDQPLYASKLRLHQQPGMGSIDEPNIIWLTEIEIYGTPSTGDDGNVGLVAAVGTEFTVAQPLLKVQNLTGVPSSVAAGLANPNHFYFFEVAADSAFTQVLSASDGIPEQDGGITAWKIEAVLEANTTYYWRASLNHELYTEVVAFTLEDIIHPYPNPYRMSEVNQVIFTGLPEGSNLIILTVSGDVVRRFTGLSGQDLPWDGRNELGNQVATGTYLWFVENSNINGKLIVFR